MSYMECGQTDLAVGLVHHRSEKRCRDAARYRPQKHAHLLFRHDVTGDQPAL